MLTFLAWLFLATLFIIGLTIHAPLTIFASVCLAISGYLHSREKIS